MSNNEKHCSHPSQGGANIWRRGAHAKQRGVAVCRGGSATGSSNDDKGEEECGCYDSNISPTYRGHLVGLRMSDSAQWPRCFCIIGQLVPNLAERSDVFPFCYDSNISLIYCRHPVGLQMSESAQWPRHFCIIGQLAPNSAECSDVFPFITFHFSFFQIYFHHYLAYLISDISRGTCI